MRKLLFAFLGFFLLSGYVVASGWMHDYDDALEKAQKENKLILMMYVKKT